MAKFRKKPVVIEATQWFKDGDHPAVIRKTAPDRHADEGIPWVPTLEGGHVVTSGDWIITGVKGEHYPCKADIFRQTYEPAEGEPWPPSWDGRDKEAFNRALGVAVGCYQVIRHDTPMDPKEPT
jgi:hypothetical protein